MAREVSTSSAIACCCASWAAASPWWRHGPANDYPDPPAAWPWPSAHCTRTWHRHSPSIGHCCALLCALIALCRANVRPVWQRWARLLAGASAARVAAAVDARSGSILRAAALLGFQVGALRKYRRRISRESKTKTNNKLYIFKIRNKKINAVFQRFFMIWFECDFQLWFLQYSKTWKNLILTKNLFKFKFFFHNFF